MRGRVSPHIPLSFAPLKKNKGQKIQHEQSSCLVTIATERLLSYLAIHYERALVDRERVGKGGDRGRKRERDRQREREREREKEGRKEGIFSVSVAGKWNERQEDDTEDRCKIYISWKKKTRKKINRSEDETNIFHKTET